MKTVTINGSQREFTVESKVFKNLIDDLCEEFTRESKVISKIVVDGRELTTGEQDQMADTSIAQMGNIEIVTVAPSELALETIETLIQYANRIMTYITKAAQGYKQKNYIIADDQFLRTVEAMDLFVQTVGGVKAALRVGMNSKVALAEATLLSIMSDLLDAKKQNNYVMLADLLEHDLLESLIEWRDEVFPLLKDKASQ